MIWHLHSEDEDDLLQTARDLYIVHLYHLPNIISGDIVEPPVCLRGLYLVIVSIRAAFRIKMYFLYVLACPWPSVNQFDLTQTVKLLD